MNNNSKSKQKRINPTVKLLIAICIPIIAFLGSILSDYFQLDGVSAACLAIWAVSSLLAVFAFFWYQGDIKAYKLEQEREEKEAEEVKKKQEYIQFIADGGFIFPVEEFYSQCIKANCSDIDSSVYNQKKAKLLADQILKNNDIPPEYYHIYNTDILLNKYIELGKESERKKQLEKEEEKKRLEEKRIADAKKPHQAKPSKKEQEAIELQDAVIGLYGQEKRAFDLRNAIKTVEEKMKALEPKLPKRISASDYRQALELSSAIRMSAAKEKTQDWSIAAGIANGIAGPAAGMAVAADIMHNNAAIEARNRQNQASANNLANDIQRAAIRSILDPPEVTPEQKESQSKYDKLCTKKRDLEKRLDALKLKIVLDDIDQSDIMKSVEVVSKSVQENKSKVLKVSVVFQNSFEVKNMPKDVHFILDGSFKCDVYAGEMYVGSFNLPLPMNGIECGKTGTANGFCNMYSLNQEEYTVQIQPNSIWIMEK